MVLQEGEKVFMSALCRIRNGFPPNSRSLNAAAVDARRVVDGVVVWDCLIPLPNNDSNKRIALLTLRCISVPED